MRTGHDRRESEERSVNKQRQLSPLDDITVPVAIGGLYVLFSPVLYFPTLSLSADCVYSPVTAFQLLQFACFDYAIRL